MSQHGAVLRLAVGVSPGAIRVHERCSDPGQADLTGVRVPTKIEMNAGTEVAEKWSGRLVPVLSSAIGGTPNYYFVREWGPRVKRYFWEKHLSVRARLELQRVEHGQLPVEVSADRALPAD